MVVISCSLMMAAMILFDNSVYNDLEANMLFLESLIGVRFSYLNTTM